MITKDTTIGDIMKENPNLAPILMGLGMHCFGCPASLAETIEEAAQVHGISPDKLVTVLNNELEGKY